MPLFGFGLKDDPASVALKGSRRFVLNATVMIGMFDEAFKALKTDISELSNNFTKLGEKHVTYGVKPEYFPIMGSAMLHMLFALLGDGFTREKRMDFSLVYDALAEDMIAALTKAAAERK